MRASACGVYAGHSFEIPPTVVRSVFVKSEPTAIGGIFVVKRAAAAVLTLGIKILGTASDVVKNTVQNYFDTFLFGLQAQIGKNLICAEHWIDNLVVLGVVLVVAVRFEYRVEVQRRYAQTF